MKKPNKTKVGDATRNAGGRPRKQPVENLPADTPAPALLPPAPPLPTPPPTESQQPSEQPPDVPTRAVNPWPLSTDPAVACIPHLRLNARPPPTSTPSKTPLSHEDVLRRARLLAERPNDACSCADVGAPAPGDPGFVEHSFLCQIYHCYAREVGCCSPHFLRESKGLEYAHNLMCECFEGAFAPDRICPLMARERPRVFREARLWPSAACILPSGESRGSGGRHMKRCDHVASCLCETYGTYVPTCPWRRNAASGKLRGEELAWARGHAFYDCNDARIGSESLPSPPWSP